jgi:hypothetical protein
MGGIWDNLRGKSLISNVAWNAPASGLLTIYFCHTEKARWAVTNRTNVAKILEASGTSITTKGNFYAAGKEPGLPGCVEITLGGDGGTGCLQDLCHVCTVCDGPTCLHWKSMISLVSYPIFLPYLRQLLTIYFCHTEKARCL